MTDVLGLEGKKALIIGAGPGIARSTALLLAKAGAQVAVADISAERATALAKEIGGHAIVGNVTIEADARRIVDEAHHLLGGLSRLVNVVGDSVVGEFKDTPSSVWDAELRLNLLQQMYVCHAAVPHMIAEGGGAMALVSSLSAAYGARMHVVYGVAKAGVEAFARGIADEWGRHGIRVNTVAPYANATPLVIERTGMPAKEAYAALDAMAAQEGLPLGRFGRPEEIAGPLVFLLSDLASFITGQCVVADGGRFIHFPFSFTDEHENYPSATDA